MTNVKRMMEIADAQAKAARVVKPKPLKVPRVSRETRTATPSIKKGDTDAKGGAFEGDHSDTGSDAAGASPKDIVSGGAVHGGSAGAGGRRSPASGGGGVPGDQGEGGPGVQGAAQRVSFPPTAGMMDRVEAYRRGGGLRSTSAALRDLLEDALKRWEKGRLE